MVARRRSVYRQRNTRMATAAARRAYRDTNSFGSDPETNAWALLLFAFVCWAVWGWDSGA